MARSYVRQNVVNRSAQVMRTMVLIVCNCPQVKVERDQLFRGNGHLTSLKFSEGCAR